MTNSIKSRVLATVIALAMLLSMLPTIQLHVHAAGTLTVTDANVGLSWTDASSSKGNATWTASGTTVTGTATGYTQYIISKKSVTTTLTITNNHSDDRTLSFDYTLTGGGSVSGTISGTSGSYSKTLAAGTSTTITLTSPSGSSNTNTLTLSSLQLLSSGNVTSTFLAPENGNYTVDGAAVTTQTTKEKAASEAYALNATPASGYTFFGWWSNASESYVSYDNPASVKFGSDPQLKPVFLPANTALFGVGTAKFADLTEACNFANSTSASTKTVVLLNNGTLRGEHTIPAGVTLLIPFNASNTLYTKEPACTSSFMNNQAWVQPTAYRTLTMAGDAKITVNGAMSLSAQHAAANGGSNYCGSPTGPVSFVNMQEGSNITVNNGGKLYAWGFITGSGSVTANSGATVYENFQVTDFRGGSATGDYADNGLAFPLNQYYVQNIEVPVTFYAGASEKIYTSAYASSLCIGGEATFIGSGGMFTSGEGGYVIKDYDESSDRLNVDLYGSCELNSMTVKFSIEVNSANYLLPITNNVSIGIHSGTTTLKQSVALFPGVEVTVDQGATLNLAYSGKSINDFCADGYNIIVYDRDEWFYGLSLAEATMGEEITGVKYGLVLNSKAPTPNGYSAKPSYFAPVLYAPGRTDGRTDADLKDAVLDINGTLIANGFIYTTIGGAAIKSTGKTGEIQMVSGAGADMITCQNNGTTGVTLGLMIRSAWLQNGDGSYLQTMAFDEETGDPIYAAEPGTVYEYCATCDCWYTGVCEGCREYTLTFNNEDGTPITDIVAVNGSTVSYNGPVPTKPATAEYTYTFAGWKSSLDDNVYASDALPKVTSDVTYTATFTSETREYTVTWVDGDGKTLYSEDIAYGTDPSYGGDTPTKTATAQYTYTFKGWDKEFEAVTGDVTYTATFTSTVNKYEVTWKNGDGDLLLTEEYDYGDTPEYKDDTPTKAADGCTVYDFSGWDKDVVAVTGEATYTAVFTAGTNHLNVVTDNAKDPTCGETGLTEGSHCEACGVTIVAQAVIPATGNHTGGDATCSAQAICEACGQPYGDTDPTNHAWTIGSYTNNGETHTVNYVCGNDPTHTKSESDKPHSYDGPTHTCVCQAVEKFTITWIVDGTATTETYSYGATPSYKGSTDKSPDQSYHYTFTGWDTTPVAATGDATYTAEFSVTAHDKAKIVDGKHYCSVCNYLMGSCNDSGNDHKCDVGNEVMACGNAYLTLTKGQAPTCDADGWKDYYTCSCGKLYEDENAVKGIADLNAWKNGDGKLPATGHSGEPDYTDNGDGTHSATYSECGCSYVTNEPHSYTAGVCVCQNKQTFTVTWIVDGNETTETYSYGATPSFNGSTNKAPDQSYHYTFTGWDTTPVAATGNATYTAEFSVTAHNTSKTENGKHYCSVCNYLMGSCSYTPANAVWNDDKTECTVTGTCETCGGKVTASAAISSAVTTEADCMTEKVTTYTATFTEAWITEKTVKVDVTGEKDPSNHTGGTPVHENIEDAKCETAGSYDEVVYCTECGAEVSRTNKEIPALTHDWAAPTYTWSDDGKECTAERTCKRDGSHKETETATAIGVVTTPATCTEKGTTTYTANFDADWAVDGQTATRQDVAAKNHAWTIGSYTNNGETHTENYVCGNDPTHTKSESGKPHTYDGTTHVCVCQAVEKFTVTWIVDGNETTETYAYGATPSFKGSTDKAADAGLTYTFKGWDKELVNVTENTAYTALYSVTGFVYTDNGFVYKNEDDVQKTEWTKIGNAWYYLDPVTGIRAEGISRVPYPTAFGNYGPDGRDLGKEDFPDTDTALFVFGEDGRFLSNFTGLTSDGHWAVNGMLPWFVGLVEADGDYYYFGANNVMVTPSHRTGGRIYLSRDGRTDVSANDVFVADGIYFFGADGKLIKNDGVTEMDGELYYFDNYRLALGAGLIKESGNYYYVRSSGKLVVNQSYWIYNVNEYTDINIGTYLFDENGVMDVNSAKNGVYEEDNGLFYYENGRRTYKGLIEYDGSLIYVRSNGQLVTGRYWITKTNGIEGFVQGSYHFGTDGKILNGVADGFYYENGKPAYKGLMEYNGGYIYVRSNGQLATGQYWVSKHNELAPVGNYNFGTDGKMLIDELPAYHDGVVNGYYYVDGVIQYGAGPIVWNGDVYYVRSNGQVATGAYWTTTSNEILPSGRYTFDPTGKLITD
ncbi:MAG: hypothetical protein IKM04_07935 [Clostridia bacterium]|nr:hypothetical protein [Clostridia bacterium]